MRGDARFLCCCLATILVGQDSAAEPPQRTPWTTSRVVGSPDPPKRFRAERVFRNVRFRNPVDITFVPGSDRLAVVEQYGNIFTISPATDGGRKHLFVDLSKDVRTLAKTPKAQGIEAAYGIAFHPKFAENRFCYICYVLKSKKPGEQLPDGSRVSRFRVTKSDPPRIEPESETILLTFLSGGHNGGSLQFGRDGFLYISTGDATDPNPPDKFKTGQDCGDLLSSILRIDVDRAEGGRTYAIPRDNPFLNLPGVRPEIWAFGFRNPWRMSIDRATGDLWVGDVGWELWEMVHRVSRGGNYGWSIVEGRQPVRGDVALGPAPIIPPTIELSHTVSASVTGGYVYRGKKFPDLYGAYVFGDWETRRLWAARHDGTKLLSFEELTEPELRIVGFGEDRDGELYVLDYDAGTVHTLARNPPAAATTPFPTKLSATGLFASVAGHRPAAGVMPFSINAEQWSDHATAERWLALPGTSAIIWHANDVPIPGSMFSRLLEFPANGVLAKTFSLDFERGNPASRKRIETQLLHYDGKQWRGYSYAWNDAQTDATLVPAEGMDRHLSIRDASMPGGKRDQIWTHYGRAQCMLCHNPWAQTTLAFNIPQLNRNGSIAGAEGNQLALVEQLGVVERRRPDGKGASPLDVARLPRLPTPHQADADLAARARGYLHVNCGHCHRFGGGGSVDLQLHYFARQDELKVVNARPMQGNFGLPNAAIVAPGDPCRSVLYFRMAKFGRGRMPHLGSEIVDETGLELIGAWIRSLALQTNAKMPTTPAAATTPTTTASEVALAGLLANPTTALGLARDVGTNRLSPGLRERVVAAAAKHPATEIRDLFTGFLPPDPRGPRLGSNPRPAAILALAGDATRGKQLFWNEPNLNCKTCHRIAGAGIDLGPDLTKIGAQRTRADLLESLLDASKRIEPRYVGYVLQTTDGKVHSGLLVRKDAKGVVLRTAANLEVKAPAAEVERFQPMLQSFMPEGLLRDLTALQAADLVEFLASLR